MHDPLTPNGVFQGFRLFRVLDSHIKTDIIAGVHKHIDTIHKIVLKMSIHPEADHEYLIHEARVFMDYLIGCTDARDAYELYASAHKHHFTSPQNAFDNFVVRISVTSPFLLPLLDSACVFWRPSCLLRSKLVLASAILEADTEHCQVFFPRPERPVSLIAKCTLLGIRFLLQLLPGLILLAFIRIYVRCTKNENI